VTVVYVDSTCTATVNGKVVWFPSTLAGAHVTVDDIPDVPTVTLPPEVES
jgi:hypothetical protein